MKLLLLEVEKRLKRPRNLRKILSKCQNVYFSHARDVHGFGPFVRTTVCESDGRLKSNCY